MARQRAWREEGGIARDQINAGGRDVLVPCSRPTRQPGRQRAAAGLPAKRIRDPPAVSKKLMRMGPC